MTPDELRMSALRAQQLAVAVYAAMKKSDVPVEHFDEVIERLLQLVHADAMKLRCVSHH